MFLQVLEGGRAAVNRLYNRIVADPRHKDVELLSYQQIGERHFAGWSMGQVNVARLNPSLLLKYSATAQLDPYAMSGSVALALLEELVATASIVGQPYGSACRVLARQPQHHQPACSRRSAPCRRTACRSSRP